MATSDGQLFCLAIQVMMTPAATAFGTIHKIAFQVLPVQAKATMMVYTRYATYGMYVSQPCQLTGR